jgi:hypothetical protein
MLIFVGVALLSFQVSCVGVDEKPASSEYCYECEPISLLNECNCERWMTYVDDVTNYLITFMRIKGQDIDRDVAYRYMSPHADMHKAVYILGLKNAFNTAYTSQDKQLYLPYKAKQYYNEIDTFCKKPENNDKKISEVLLMINGQLRKAQQ